MANEFEGVTPILRVKKLADSIAYYTQKLGFTSKWRSDIFANVCRGKCQLFLSQGDQGAGRAWVWISVEDVDTLFAEYQAAGARLRHPPTNYGWACEMQVEDLDGNILRMGSEPKDEPLGEWLDEQGQVWHPDGHGKWNPAG